MGNSVPEFWTVNIGTIISSGLLLLAFWRAHVGNVERIKTQAKEWQQVRSTLEKLENLEEKLKTLDLLVAQMNIMYPVFVRLFIDRASKNSQLDPENFK